jgi:ABC-type antimicrobial peptide transport system permease subunit
MLQYFIEALAVLNGNRTRSFLTTLGLIIGVMAVISIQVLGAGTASAVGGLLGNLNDRSFVVVPVTTQANFTRARLKLSDLGAITAQVPHVIQAIPAGGIARQTRLGNHSARLLISPESELHFVTTPALYGSTFTSDQVYPGMHVCVLTNTGYDKLKLTGDPTGQSIHVGEHRYIVTGVLANPSGGIAPSVGLADGYIPYTTFENDFIRGSSFAAVRALVDDSVNIPQAEGDTKRVLAALRKGKAEYQSFDRKSASAGIDGIFAVLSLIVALIGAVSLVVAGIGILNIMLVSVAERTREIGLRKAIGATSFQVLAQFFIEALLLSAIGCGIGLVLGLGLGGLVNGLFIIKLSGVVAPLPWLSSTLIATGFATVVTLLFGTYPAYRAAKLDPIEALRYE